MVHDSRQKRRWTRCASWAVVLVVGLFVVWSLRPRLGLLDRAEKIAEVHDWTGSEYITGRYPLYNWLTDSDVLFFRQDPGRSSLQGYRQTILPIGHAQPPVKIPGLAATFFDPTIKAFSARGNWILQSRYDARTNRELEELISLKDGSVKRLDRFPDASWSADGRYVVQRLPGKLLLYQPEAGVTLRIPLPTMKEFPGTPAPMHHGSDYGEVLWAVPGKSLIFVRRGRTFDAQDVRQRPYMASSENTTTIEFAMCDLADTSKPMKLWTVPTPTDAFRGGVSVLPGGDKLAWSVLVNGRRPFDALLHRLLPTIFPASRNYFSYRISDLNGANARELLRYDNANMTVSVKAIQNAAPSFKWMRDGKHLSCVYKGVLYRIPID